jgi:hypothetical protein
MGPFTPGTAREIPDPQAEMERLAAARKPSTPADQLRYISDELRKIIDNPPPQVTIIGKLVLHPETGEPLPDAALKVAALKLLLRVTEEMRRLPAVVASVTVEEINAAVEKVRAEVAEAERQAEAERGDDGQG